MGTRLKGFASQGTIHWNLTVLFYTSTGLSGFSDFPQEATQINQPLICSQRDRWSIDKQYLPASIAQRVPQWGLDKLRRLSLSSSLCSPSLKSQLALDFKLMLSKLRKGPGLESLEKKKNVRQLAKNILPTSKFHGEPLCTFASMKKAKQAKAKVKRLLLSCLGRTNHLKASVKFGLLWANKKHFKVHTLILTTSPSKKFGWYMLLQYHLKPTKKMVSAAKIALWKTIQYLADRSTVLTPSCL